MFVEIGEFEQVQVNEGVCFHSIDRAKSGSNYCHGKILTLRQLVVKFVQSTKT